jgi:hypothetical protein
MLQRLAESTGGRWAASAPGDCQAFLDRGGMRLRAAVQPAGIAQQAATLAVTVPAKRASHHRKAYFVALRSAPPPRHDRAVAGFAPPDTGTDHDPGAGGQVPSAICAPPLRVTS